MSGFLGNKYKLETSENFDEYMKGLGEREKERESVYYSNQSNYNTLDNEYDQRLIISYIYVAITKYTLFLCFFASQ